MSDLMKKGVDPQVLQIMLLDELCGRMEELTTELSAYNRFKGPLTRPFKRELQYQFATIPAHGLGRVYYLKNPQPDLLMGLIVQVGNAWFPNTYLEWLIDYYPRRIDYVIGDVHAPKHYERGLPFEYEVEWKAYNNDTVAHTFEVLCDGFFIPKEVYGKIAK